MMEQKLDGNAAGGILREIFPFEMTMAEVTCTKCSATGPIGTLAAYMHGMGTILRCPRCDNVLIRIVHAKGRYWLDMQGVRVLQIKYDDQSM
jgi:NAD-dependent SIR2 family protein deacetylase